MPNYEIKIQVDIRTTEQDVTPDARPSDDGSFRIVIGRESGQSINQCERALLAVNYPAIREALSRHLSEVSKQEAEAYRPGVLKKNTHPYPVDGEIGRFSFETYSRVNLYDEVLYNTSREFFSPLQGEEKYQTEGFKEIALMYGTTEESFRKTSLLINRIRHQEEGGTPFRTMREVTEHEGRLLQEHLEQKTSRIFQENGFMPEGYPEGAIANAITPSPSILEEADLVEMLVHYDLFEDSKTEIVNNPVPYEDAETAVHISVDDVGVKRQKENREKTKEYIEKYLIKTFTD